MAGVNKVILVGNLGKDPEVRYTGSGQAVANFSLATSENWTDKAGQKQERTEWHRIVVWGKLGELCGEYLTKGRQVYLEGRIQTREWVDKENKKNYSTEIVVSNVVFLKDGSAGKDGQPRKAGASAAQAGGGDDFGPPPPGFDDAPQSGGSGGGSGGGRGGGPSEDDIPF